MLILTKRGQRWVYASPLNKKRVFASEYTPLGPHVKSARKAHREEPYDGEHPISSPAVDAC